MNVIKKHCYNNGSNFCIIKNTCNKIDKSQRQAIKFMLKST